MKTTETPKWRPVGEQLWPDTLGRVKTFVIDNKGNRWWWNCGWFIVDKDGKPLRTRAKRPESFWTFASKHDDNRCMLSKTKQRPDQRQQPMTHAQFRKCVKLLDPAVKAQREVLHGMDRPGRAWRRLVHREVMTHDLFGSVYLLASDGCHAVIETIDGEHEYVCFENLSELVVTPLPPRLIRDSDGKVKQQTNKREAKRQEVVASLLSKYTALANQPND